MEHFTAIKLIERLAPAINESQDPKGTLIKYAKDNNLAVAELERLGQVYNSAKTLSHLEKSANRGDTYNLLDINDLLSAYVDHEVVPKAIEKSASAGPVIRNGGHLPNFFNVETLEKKASTSTEHELADTIRRNVTQAETQKELNFLAEVPGIINDLRSDIIKSAKAIAKKVYLSNQDPVQVFTKLAQDSLASINQNKDAVEFICKKASDFFGVAPVVEFEKLASAAVVTDTTGFLDQTERMQEMINLLGELTQIEKQADAFKELAKGKTSSEEDELKQLQNMEFETSTDEEDTSEKSDSGSKDGGTENNNPEPPKKPKKTPDAVPTGAILAYLMEQRNLDTENANQPTAQSASASPSKQLADIIAAQIDRTYDSRVKPLMDIKKTDRGYVNAAVDKTISSVDTAATIHELMQDPIIAAHSPRTVVSIYNSLAQTNPKMMQDKNVAKFALREALQYEGITPHSYGQLVDIEKDRSDIAKNNIATQQALYGR